MGTDAAIADHCSGRMSDGPDLLLQERLACPLCSYDLRGLSAGRCPECGHAFNPVELRRAQELRHPYLFEHHPRRPWHSVAATLMGSCRPGRFWKRLRPETPLYPRRVVGYWFLLQFLALMQWLAFWAYLVFAGGTSSQWTAVKRRYSYIGVYRAMPRWRQDVQDEITNGDYVAEQWSRIIEILLEPIARLWPMLVLVLAWGWGVVLCMQIFRRTMRQARIDTGHVLRVGLYGGDVLPLFLLATLALSLITWGRPLYHLEWFTYWPYSNSFLTLEAGIVLPLMLFSGWRFLHAHRRYLRLPHALATVAAIELILGLAAIAFLLRIRIAILQFT